VKKQSHQLWQELIETNCGQPKEAQLNEKNIFQKNDFI
jgi:hypothetical protein